MKKHPEATASVHPVHNHPDLLRVKIVTQTGIAFRTYPATEEYTAVILACMRSVRVQSVWCWGWLGARAQDD